MLATACSNDEVVQVAENGAAIGFSSFVDNATRAADNTLDNLTSFRVYGVAEGMDVNPFIEFNGVEVTRADKDAAWDYDNHKYWIPNFSYSFAAVAPVSGNIGVENGTNKVRGGITAIKLTNDGNVDVLYGYKEDAVQNQTVQFTLGHILSRVKFAFENGLAEGYSIEVSDVTINNADTKASYNPENGTWTLATGDDGNVATAFDFPMTDDNHVAATKVANTEPKYLFPRAESEAAYTATFTVTMFNEAGANEDFVMVKNTFNVTIPAKEYKAGYSYTLKTTLNDSNIDPENKLNPIVFDVLETEDFTPGDDNTFNLN